MLCAGKEKLLDEFFYSKKWVETEDMSFFYYAFCQPQQNKLLAFRAAPESLEADSGLGTRDKAEAEHEFMFIGLILF